MEGVDIACVLGVALNGGVSYELPDSRWVFKAFGQDMDERSTDDHAEVRFVTIGCDSDQSCRCTADEIKKGLQQGTVFLNEASTFWPQIAELCAEITFSLNLPSGCNAYATAPGRACSNPVHTDHHDVVILQTQGSKRWKIFWPPAHKRGRDPFSRGKGGDLLDATELHLALDVVLDAGEVLYIPAGFPHLTSTSNRHTFKTTVHLTLHWSAHAWFLDFLNLRSALLIQAGESEALDESSVPYDVLWGTPGLFNILWHTCSFPRSWTDLWPELILRLERAESGRWDIRHLRCTADVLLRLFHGYRQQLVHLSLQIFHRQISGFGNAAGAADIGVQVAEIASEMHELKEAVLAFVNMTDDKRAIKRFLPELEGRSSSNSRERASGVA